MKKVKKRKRIKGVVLFHPGSLPHITAFDVFIRKSLAKSKLAKKIKEYLYEIDCDVAKDFQKQNPSYVYLGSEDLAHSMTSNITLVELLCELRERGFVFQTRELIFPEEPKRDRKHKAWAW